MDLIIYHNADWDGMFSAAIVQKGRMTTSRLYGMNYGDTAPDLEPYDRVIIVDFSLDVDAMVKYKDKIVWIDHHAPKIREVAEKVGMTKNGYPMIKGKYDLTGKYSAAYLCWEYCVPANVKVPECIRLVSAYDVHNKEIEPWDRTLAFQMYMRTMRMSVGAAGWLIFGDPDYCGDDEIDATLENQIKIGELMLAAKREEEARAFKSDAWPVKIGKYNGYALMTHDRSSMICEQALRNPDVDFCLLLNRHPKYDCAFACGVRVNANSDFDASEFARRHRGGGHVKASGCVLSLEEFNHLFVHGVIEWTDSSYSSVDPFWISHHSPFWRQHLLIAQWVPS